MTGPSIFRLGECAPTLPEDGHAYIAPGAIVIGDVRVSSGVSIWFNAVLRGDNEPITLGAGTNIQDGCVVHTDPGFPVEIGDDVTVGHNATIHGCRIGKGSLIGMGATVLNGATIGERCLVAANALVREGMVVPDGSLVVGIPAKIVRALDETEAAHLSNGAARYRDKARAYRLDLQRVEPSDQAG